MPFRDSYYDPPEYDFPFLTRTIEIYRADKKLVTTNSDKYSGNWDKDSDVRDYQPMEGDRVVAMLFQDDDCVSKEAFDLDTDDANGYNLFNMQDTFDAWYEQSGASSVKSREATLREIQARQNRNTGWEE